MPKITLHSPTIRNDGSYVDAGVDLAIGDQPDQISEARAADLVADNRAIETPPDEESEA